MELKCFQLYRSKMWSQIWFIDKVTKFPHKVTNFPVNTETIIHSLSATASRIPFFIEKAFILALNICVYIYNIYYIYLYAHTQIFYISFLSLHCFVNKLFLFLLFESCFLLFLVVDFFFFFFFFFLLFRVALVAYGISQARGWVGAAAAGLCHSHSHMDFTTAHSNARS